MKCVPRLFLHCAAIVWLTGNGASAWFQDNPIRSEGEFGGSVQPFLVQHCHGCHSEDSAKAGFRVDLLGADFGVPATAAQWKEVLDRITAGEMPPADQPRPPAADVVGVTEWIHGQLRGTEAAVRQAGVGVPFRRLNREEFANSIRDLLGVDERLIRPLIEELPADGKAEGFDRLGTALFVDQSQIERTLAAAARVAELTIVTEPPKVNTLVHRFELHRLRPRPADVEVFPGFAHRIPRGAEDYLVHPQHIEFIQGGPTYRRDYAGWGVVAHFSIAQTVTQDGYYRFRIRAKVDNRGRSEVNKFRLRYALNSPIQVEEEVPLDASGVTEATLFLRGPVNGEVKGPQVFNMLWNHTENAVISEPAYKAVFSDWTRLRGALERAAAERAPQDKVDMLLAERAEVEKKLNAWTGVANIHNPAMEIDKLPRLLLEAVEIEGPVQPVWPPEPHRRLLFDGDDRRDAAYVEEIFAKLLPRLPPSGDGRGSAGSGCDRAAVSVRRPFISRSAADWSAASPLFARISVSGAALAGRSRITAVVCGSAACQQLRAGVTAVVFSLEQHAG